MPPGFVSIITTIWMFGKTTYLPNSQNIGVASICASKTQVFPRANNTVTIYKLWQREETLIIYSYAIEGTKLFLVSNIAIINLTKQLIQKLLIRTYWIAMALKVYQKVKNIVISPSKDSNLWGQLQRCFTKTNWVNWMKNNNSHYKLM
jgi:hypothetical protein